MKHAYLTEVTISEALSLGVITKVEAERLMKKIECQASLFKTLHK